MSEQIELSNLVAVSYNPRVIRNDHLERLKASIKEHTKAISDEKRGDGYRLTTTVTINKNGNRIIGGHQRIKALSALGQAWIHKDDISWVDVEPDSLKEKALNITLNSEKVQGEWDDNKLDGILDDIKLDSPELYSNLDFGPIDFEEPVIESAPPVVIAPQIVEPSAVIEAPVVQPETQQAQSQNTEEYNPVSEPGFEDESPSQEASVPAPTAAPVTPEVSCQPVSTSAPEINPTTLVQSSDGNLSPATAPAVNTVPSFDEPSIPDQPSAVAQETAPVVASVAPKPPKTAPPPIQPVEIVEENGSLTIKYDVADNQNEIIVGAINKSKGTFDLEDVSSALAKLCVVWYENEMQE